MLATKRSPTRQLGAIDARTRPLLIPRYKTMINLLSLALAVAFLTTVPFSTSGFSCSSMILAANRRLVDRCLTTTFYHPPVFDRAVECVSNYGLCDLDELVELSAELERYQGCFYEDGPEACEKEINDRNDLAETLLLQGELRERDHYIKEGNLFAYDVKADKDMHDREVFFDRISPSLDI